jgi:hypothetical protein
VVKERDELGALLDEGTKRAPARPKPGGWYSPEGDCVFFYRENARSHAERVDDLLTIYRADDDGRILGAQVKGITKLPPHDLLLLRVSRERAVEIVELLLATFYRGTGAGLPGDPERARKYAEASSVLSGKIPIRATELLRK